MQAAGASDGPIGRPLAPLPGPTFPVPPSAREEAINRRRIHTQPLAGFLTAESPKTGRRAVSNSSAMRTFPA